MSKLITKRQKKAYSVQLAIAHNPHVEDPQKLVTALSDGPDISREFDPVAFANFANKVSDLRKTMPLQTVKDSPPK